MSCMFEHITVMLFKFFLLPLQHMCSLESELESQMGEFHVKMKGESLSTTSYFLHSAS